MALTAKFQADFTSFYSAVQKAEGHLATFQKDADDVGKSLDKMTDQFSGRDILQQATLMSKAIKDVGGVAVLTDQELRRLGPTFAEATAKAQKMGVDVPQDFKDITKAAEGVAEPTDNWSSSLNLVKGGIAAIVSSGLVKFLWDSAEAGIKWAGTLSRMHAQTDISYKDLQILQDVAIETSTDMSTLTKSVQVLQERLGDKSAYAGLRQLGINVDAILKMNPAEQFGEVAKAIAKIEDPTKRAAAAKAILGNAYREALPAMRANWSEIAKNTKVVADDQIEAVDRLSAKWNKFWNDQDKSWGSWLGKQAAGLEQGAANWERASERSAAARAKLFGGASELPTLPNAPQGPVAGGDAHVTGFVDPAIISDLKVYGKTLDETAAATVRATAADKTATAARQALAEMTRAGAGAEFDWQNQILLTKFKADQLTVTEKQLYEQTATLASFVAAHKADIFPYPPEGSLDAWKRGQTAVTEMAPKVNTLGNAVGFMNSHLGTVEGILGGIQTGWAQTATVGARAIQAITSNLMSGNWVGAIVAATSALGGFIAKLFGASEESKKVSPMRDEFFRLQGGLERLNPRVMELEGNLESVQAVFDARTVQQYDAAIANLNKILAQDQAALDRASESADGYADTLKKIPSKIPIDIRYTESGSKPEKGSVPGFATGTGGQFVDFGAGTLAMLHGREAIVPEGAVRNAGAGGQGAIGGAAVSVTINAQGAFFDTPGDLQRLADKVNDALTAKYGLTNRLRAA